MNFNHQDFKRNYYKYYNIKKKFLVNNANIYFNHICKTEQLIPKFALSKNISYSKPSRITNEQYTRNRINNELKYLYSKKQFMSLQLYNIELYNLNFFGNFWHQIKQSMLAKLSEFIKKKYVTLENKLQLLRKQKCNTNKCKPKNYCSFQFHEPVKNLTNIQFSASEYEQIYNNYKSNMSLPKDNIILDNIIVDTESIIQNNKNVDQPQIRYQIKSELEKHFINKIPAKGTTRNKKSVKPINNIIRKIKSNNLTINKADKGNVLTIEDKDVLKNKTLQFLDNPNFVKLKTDPTSRYPKEIKEICKKSKLIINQNDKYNLINPNPKAPNLRTNTKIHKQNFPVRPVVNYIPAPAYKFKKFLKNLLKTTLIIDNKYNIKNTVNLTEQLKDIKITNKTKIISLDIKDLYSNIPINEIIDIIRDQLKLLKQDDDKTNQIISLLELTLKQNYFKYNNDYLLSKRRSSNGKSYIIYYIGNLFTVIRKYSYKYIKNEIRYYILRPLC